MKPEEHALMFEVEDRHWWYVGLRHILGLFWNRHIDPRAPEPLRVLDMGCGTGAVLDWLAHRRSAQPSVIASGAKQSPPFGHTFATGIDLSPVAIQFCRTRGQQATAVASALALPFAPETFDAAVSCDLLCHRGVTDKEAPLRQAHAALKPGGLLFLNLPAYQWLLSSHDHAVDNDRRFTKAEALRLLRDCGFEPIEATYWNTLLFPAILLTRLWRMLAPPAASDLADGGTGTLADVFARILRVERALLHVHSMPFGLSVFVVGRKRSAAQA